MSFEFIAQLPKPREIKAAYPVPDECAAIKKEKDEEIANILTGKSDKFLLIIGPCSADNEDAVLEYVTRLRDVQERVKDKILIVPRVYTNKPRTTGIGYKGMLHQPDPEKDSDLMGGLIAIRKMHINVIKKTGMTTADEMLYPENHWYLNDVLSYNAIGARSVENQQHRLVASGVDGACGMKNPTSGDFNVMLNSIVAAQAKQRFIYRGWDVRTQGNPLAHAILRGACNKHGNNIPNYHYEDLMLLCEKYSETDLLNPAAIIDCNHNNSGKQYEQQIRITREVLHSRKYSNDIHKMVKGLMIESYLEPGAQKIGESIYMEIDGVSVNFKLSCLMLLIKDEKDWSNEQDHLNWLEQKVNDCCLYFMTQEYKSMYYMNLELCLIDVHFIYEIPESCQNLLDAMQANIAEYGVRLNIHIEDKK